MNDIIASTIWTLRVHVLPAIGARDICRLREAFPASVPRSTMNRVLTNTKRLKLVRITGTLSSKYLYHCLLPMGVKELITVFTNCDAEFASYLLRLYRMERDKKKLWVINQDNCTSDLCGTIAYLVYRHRNMKLIHLLTETVFSPHNYATKYPAFCGQRHKKFQLLISAAQRTAGEISPPLDIWFVIKQLMYDAMYSENLSYQIQQAIWVSQVFKRVIDSAFHQNCYNDFCFLFDTDFFDFKELLMHLCTRPHCTPHLNEHASILKFGCSVPMMSKLMYEYMIDHLQNSMSFIGQVRERLVTAPIPSYKKGVLKDMVSSLCKIVEDNKPY